MGRGDPWKKTSKAHLGRHGHGKNKDRKPKAQAWMVGQQAKEKYKLAHVVNARFRDIHYPDPNREPRWYTDNVGDAGDIVVPVELVLHASFEMELATAPSRGASSQQRQGVAAGAVVLAEADHNAAMEELRQRYSDES